MKKTSVLGAILNRFRSGGFEKLPHEDRDAATAIDSKFQLWVTSTQSLDPERTDLFVKTCIEPYLNVSLEDLLKDDEKREERPAPLITSTFVTDVVATHVALVRSILKQKLRCTECADLATLEQYQEACYVCSQLRELNEYDQENQIEFYDAVVAVMTTAVRWQKHFFMDRSHEQDHKPAGNKDSAEFKRQQQDIKVMVAHTLIILRALKIESVVLNQLEKPFAAKVHDGWGHLKLDTLKPGNVHTPTSPRFRTANSPKKLKLSTASPRSWQTKVATATAAPGDSCSIAQPLKENQDPALSPQKDVTEFVCRLNELLFRELKSEITLEVQQMLRAVEPSSTLGNALVELGYKRFLDQARTAPQAQAPAPMRTPVPGDSAPLKPIPRAPTPLVNSTVLASDISSNVIPSANTPTKKRPSARKDKGPQASSATKSPRTEKSPRTSAKRKLGDDE